MASKAHGQITAMRERERMARRTALAMEDNGDNGDNGDEGKNTSGDMTVDDFFQQEIDRGELDEMREEMKKEEAERLSVPEGDYLTVTPFPASFDTKLIETDDGESVQRARYHFWGDAINEETEKKAKISLDISPTKLYVIFNGAGKPPTYYTQKAKGARLDQAYGNMTRADELYALHHGSPAKRYGDIAEFLSETQLRIRVKRFASGKTGVVGFELAD